MSKQKFVIVVPTVRHPLQAAPIIHNLYASLTYPTDVHIMHGDKGKSATLNDALWHIAKYEQNATYYVTADDDYLFPLNWQTAIVNAFRDLPNLGAASLCFPEEEKYTSYMAQYPKKQQRGDTTYQPVTYGNLVGACIVTTVQTANDIGQYPHIDTHYEYDEDGYRCHRVRQLAKELAYVQADSPALIFDHQDTPEYLAQKQRDIDTIKARGLTWIK